MAIKTLTSRIQSVGEAGGTSVGADVAADLDAAVSEPVLIVGSPTPGGPDLDLLARPDDYRKLTDWLDGAGFVPWRHIWARFDEPGVYAVEMSSTERWQTARDDASSLYQEAEPVPGFSHLVTPCPAVVLLLAARGTVTRRGRISEKLRRSVSSALERDPAAWASAEQRAPGLGMAGAVALLRKAYESDSRLSALSRTAGMSAVLYRKGPLPAKVRLLTGARPKRLRPPIVSFSGLDGSGKSTQVNDLQSYLTDLGVSSERQWAGFKTGKQLRAALPVLDRGRSAGCGEAAHPSDRLMPSALGDSAVGRHAWVLAVVGINTFHLWRLVLRRRPATAVVIFDRFTPDSTVKLDLHYLRTRKVDIRWQRRLFTLISPKPDVGFFVEVTAEVARSRRLEEPLEQLVTMSELYREQVPRYGLHRLDGTEPSDQLAKQVAASAWRGLQ